MAHQVDMEDMKLKSAIEALIFASEQPLKLEKITELLADAFANEFDSHLDKKEVKALIENIRENSTAYKPYSLKDYKEM